MLKLTSNDRGFSLIELVIAIFILAIGILGYMSLFGSSIRGTTFSREYTLAATMGQSQIDTLLSTSFSNSNLSPGTHGPFTFLEDRFSANTTYTVDYNATAFAPYRKIALQVNWTSNNQPYSIVFQTFKREE